MGNDDDVENATTTGTSTQKKITSTSNPNRYNSQQNSDLQHILYIL